MGRIFNFLSHRSEFYLALHFVKQKHHPPGAERHRHNQTTGIRRLRGNVILVDKNGATEKGPSPPLEGLEYFGQRTGVLQAEDWSTSAKGLAPYREALLARNSTELQHTLGVDFPIPVESRRTGISYIIICEKYNLIFSKKGMSLALYRKFI